MAEHVQSLRPPSHGRHAKVTDRRTRRDRALLIRQLVNDAILGKKPVLVMDNQNIHASSSLPEAFEPEEARRIPERLEIPCTPRHGSWLNIAEIETGILSRQCLSRRMPDREAMIRQVGA